MGDPAYRFGARRVTLSHPDKVLFPGAGLTKRDVADYYARVASTLLPHVAERPVTLHRFPDGIAAGGFFQKETPEHFPAWFPSVELPKAGGTVRYPLIDGAAALVYLADQGCITPHVFLSRRDRPDRPDRLVIDLDPSDDDFAKVRRVARRVLDALAASGARPFLQLTGSRGVHAVLALDRSAPFDRVREVAAAFCAVLARHHPDEATTAQRKAQRGSRVFLDYLRNAYGQTMVAPYALRARPGAPVATPIEPAELDRAGLAPDRYRIDNLFRRLARKADPWRDIDRHAVAIDGLAAWVERHARE